MAMMTMSLSLTSLVLAPPLHMVIETGLFHCHGIVVRNCTMNLHLVISRAPCERALAVATENAAHTACAPCTWRGATARAEMLSSRPSATAGRATGCPLGTLVRSTVIIVIDIARGADHLNRPAEFEASRSVLVHAHAHVRAHVGTRTTGVRV